MNIIKPGLNYFFILIAFSLLFGCSDPEKEKLNAYIKEGEGLARTYCITCHKEAPPELLDKKTWVFNVLPQMGPRLGMFKYKDLHYQGILSSLIPDSAVLTQEQWENLVEYFYLTSPESLPSQDFEKKPSLDCETFTARPFSKDFASSSIITASEIDTVEKAVFAVDARDRTLFKFDFEGNILDQMKLSSPATSIRRDSSFIDITLAGILHPNNESKGEIVRYGYADGFNEHDRDVLVDSLYRPVTSVYFDFNYDGKKDYLVCEYGNDVGRLCLYFANDEGRYDRYIIQDVSGAIMVKPYDFDGDGFMDIAALFAQGDEKIMIYYNDGKGDFHKLFTMAARFPPVYGSMYFDLHDMNGDGYVDILYVNGDNFDYSQILKPYHGIRIFENDGYNNFEQKYFFPVHGAGGAKVCDFDLDGDADIMITSNFADMEHNPERGIIYLENRGKEYTFNPYSFRAAAQNQWNTINIADLDADGDQDVLIGAMNLKNVFNMDFLDAEDVANQKIAAMLLLENQTY